MSVSAFRTIDKKVVYITVPAKCGQRVQSLQALKLSKSNLSNGTYTFYID